MLGARFLQTQQWRVSLNEGKQCDHQAGQAAGIAKPPAPAGQSAQPVPGGDRRQHGVIENLTDFECDIGDRENDQRIDHVFCPRTHVPQQRRARDGDRGPRGEPGFAPPGPVGNRAQHRADQGDQQAGYRQRPAPLFRAGHLVGGDRGGEIGRKHKGDDDRRKRGIGPVINTPGDAGAAKARSVGGGGSGIGDPHDRTLALRRWAGIQEPPGSVCFRMAL